MQMTQAGASTEIAKLVFGAAVLALAFAPGGASAKNVVWQASEVKQITVTPTPAVAGEPATIQCTWEGVGELQFIEGSEAAQYLHLGAGPPHLPGFLRVMGTDLQQLIIGGLGVGQTQSSPPLKWSPLTSSAGKTVTIECVLDPNKKVHYSSKSVEVPVVAKKDAPPLATPPGTGGGSTKTVTWQASEVKEIKVTPNPAVAGQPATIQCTWEGVGELQFLEGSDAASQLHAAAKPMLGGLVRAMGTDIQKMLVGPLGVGQTQAGPPAKWTPLTSSIGKTVTIECVIDPNKKVHYSSKAIEVAVVATAQHPPTAPTLTPPGPPGTASPAPGAGAPTPPPMLAPPAEPRGQGRAPPPASGTAVPAVQSPTLPAVQVPGCEAITGRPGEFSCASREGYAACEQRRGQAGSGIRACQAAAPQRGR